MTAVEDVEIRVSDDAEAHRYEVHVGETLAGHIDYHAQEGLVTVLHTEIDPSFEGRGLGSTFVAAMLDDVRSKGSRVLAVCPFVVAYLKRHPEYADLAWKPT